MGCCMGKKILKILAGLALVGISLKYVAYDPWLVVGLFFLLVGISPFLCQCDACKACGTGMKKK